MPPAIGFRPSRKTAMASGIIVAAPVIVLWDVIAGEWYARDAEGELVALATSIALGDSRVAPSDRFGSRRNNPAITPSIPHLQSPGWPPVHPLAARR